MSVTRPVDGRADRLYVSDSQVHRVLMFTAAGRFVGSFGENGNAPGAFNYPTHLALMRDGGLLVTDTLNYRVQALADSFRKLDFEGQQHLLALSKALSRDANAARD